jgi:hypothetical protein
MDTYNDKVKARTAIAEALQSTHRTIAGAVGLLDDDLAVIVSEGQNAARADAEQKTQQAEQSADMSLIAAEVAGLLSRETALRARIPAVVLDLEAAGQQRLALFLRRLGYERFRVKELEPPADAPAPSEDEAAALQRVVRVPREDHPTRLLGLALWIEAMRAPGREAIVEALARRGVSASDLADLGAQARLLAERGRNVRQPVPATAREAAAVAAQRTRWNAVRRLVKLAAARDSSLAALFAAC